MNTPQPSAVLLLAYGSPATLDELPAYLQDVRGGRPPSPELLREMRARYQQIGGSPLTRLTFAQAEALRAELAGRGRPQPVYVGMRHWTPRIHETLARMQADGVRDAVALVLAPHYSALSVARYRQAVEAAVAALGGAAAPRVRFVDAWWQQPRLLEAWTELLRDALAAGDDPTGAGTHVVFTAHSLPARARPAGDPYERQLHAQAAELARRVGLPRWSFAFQSAGATPDPWLGPALEEELPRLAREGARRVLVAPIGFVCDHVEILFDLDLEARQLAATHGLAFARTALPNTRPAFIAALADAVTAPEAPVPPARRP